MKYSRTIDLPKRNERKKVKDKGAPEVEGKKEEDDDPNKLDIKNAYDVIALFSPYSNRSYKVKY